MLQIQLYALLMMGGGISRNIQSSFQIKINCVNLHLVGYHHHHHHVQEGLGLIPVPCILKMKLAPPSLPRSSYVSSSFWFILQYLFRYPVCVHPLHVLQPLFLVLFYFLYYILCSCFFPNTLVFSLSSFVIPRISLDRYWNIFRMHGPINVKYTSIMYLFCDSNSEDYKRDSLGIVC